MNKTIYDKAGLPILYNQIVSFFFFLSVQDFNKIAAKNDFKIVCLFYLGVKKNAVKSFEKEMKSIQFSSVCSQFFWATLIFFSYLE